MKESNNLKITAYGAKAKKLEELGEALRKQYRLVICTGILENTRPPHMGSYRAYYTIVLEDDEAEGGDE